jgi:hypothetical protein
MDRLLLVPGLDAEWPLGEGQLGLQCTAAAKLLMPSAALPSLLPGCCAEAATSNAMKVLRRYHVIAYRNPKPQSYFLKIHVKCYR